MRTNNTDSLPFPIIFTSLIVCCQWFAYGCLLHDLFIQIPNFLGCLLSAFQLSLFLIYSGKKSNQTYPVWMNKTSNHCKFNDNWYCRSVVMLKDLNVSYKLFKMHIGMYIYIYLLLSFLYTPYEKPNGFFHHKFFLQWFVFIEYKINKAS